MWRGPNKAHIFVILKVFEPQKRLIMEKLQIQDKKYNYKPRNN